MDWSRLGGAVFDALLIAFVVAPLVSPPDPITQLIVLPTVFVVALVATYRYDLQFYARGWKRHALFVVLLLASQFVWRLLVRVEGLTPAFYSPIRLFVLLGGLALAAWLAYFGGLERLRAEASRAASSE